MSLKIINFMKEALNEAKKAFNIDEVPVGAVIVKDGNIISRSHNKNIKLKDSTAHAEILAIKEACDKLGSHRLDDCDLYVTLEPCSMCAGAISLAKIRRLYFGTEDTKGGAVYNGAKIFESKSCHHKPEIYENISHSDCQEILREFFRNKR